MGFEVIRDDDKFKNLEGKILDGELIFLEGPEKVMEVSEYKGNEEETTNYLESVIKNKIKDRCERIKADCFITDEGSMKKIHDNFYSGTFYANYFKLKVE